MTHIVGSRKTIGLSVIALALCSWVTPSWAGKPLNEEKKGALKQGKTFAQRLVDEAATKHPELTGLEMSATPPGKQACVTIAATEAKELGEKCDNDEFTALKTNKPFVEKEKEGGKEVYDITMPLHDAAGKMIGTLGMDFKPEPGQQELDVVKRAKQIAGELEKQISSKAKLFEPE